ncbi:tail fiber protein [Bacillus phage P59]|nr:tail fiber protein [Bacillus phage P59]
MADTNLNQAPYNDRFDPEKQRNKVLFRPDRPLQQAELNELQSISEHNLRKLGDSIFSDGAMQTGMSFSVDEGAGTITVEDGLVYLAGKIRQFKKQTIPFTSTGNEKIGVKLDRVIVTHNEDPNLLDQTQGVDSYLSAGADRLEERVILTNNDPSAPNIYEFNDGALFVQPDRPEFSLINDILAQRTYEESGSYQVEGFKMWAEKSQAEGKVDLIIDRGIGYVLGYRIAKPTSTRIPLNKSASFKNVAQETHTYDTAVRKNRIGSASVKEVKQVLARTQSPAGGIQVSKGSADGRDSLPGQYTSVDPSTVVLWTTSPEVYYTYGTDYTIVEDSGVQYVDWATGLNGKEPVTGTSYNMSFEYDRIYVSGTDFKVTMVPIEGSPGWDTYIDFNGMTGMKPKDKGMIRVSYDYYLARADVITLNAEGQFTVIEGQPDRASAARPPVHEDPLTLKIGEVFVYPNSDDATALNNGVVRLTMPQIVNLKDRLENVEYNQAIEALENQSIVSDDPLALRGVFADGFVDFSRMDLNASSVALSLEDASITLMVNAPTDKMRIPEFSENASIASSWGRLVTAPYTEKKEISQPLATEAMNINPYAVYNKLGVLNLTPGADNWIEQDKITVNKEDTMTVRMDRWWAHKRSTSVHKDLRNLINEVDLDGNQNWDMGLGYKYDVTNGRTGTLTDVATTVRDSAIEFIRPREISFSASNLQPMSSNLFLTFDGIRVPVTPTGSTVAGSQSGTVNANAQGVASGKFTIPAGIRTGVREVVLQNDDNLAMATYTAQGTLKTTEEVITKTRVTINLYDPLAQSFVFPQDRVVTSFDVYFASKSSTDNIIAQVRGLSDGGFPNQTVYAERILKPSDITTSADGSVATKIALDDPLMAKAGQSYCLVLITDSNDYTAWVGTLGQNRVDAPSQTVVSQPYVNGVLFSSSNARTWSVHQESDLKFNVYTAEFQEHGVVEFNTMQDLDADMLLLMATYLTPANTGCIWEVKTVAQSDVGSVSIDSVPWQPLANYVEQVTAGTVVGLVKLRATFKANRYISPMLTLEDLMFVSFISETEGDYVSRNIDASESPFNTVTVSFDAHTPSGTTVTPMYSLDGGQTYEGFTEAPVVTKQSAEFNRYTFNERVSSTAINEQLKIKLELRADNRFVRPRARRLTAVFKDEV